MRASIHFRLKSLQLLPVIILFWLAQASQSCLGQASLPVEPGEVVATCCNGYEDQCPGPLNVDAPVLVLYDVRDPVGQGAVLELETVGLESLGQFRSRIDDMGDQLFAVEEISHGPEVGTLLRLVGQDGVTGDATLAHEELLSLLDISLHGEYGLGGFFDGKFSHQDLPREV